MTHLDPVPQRDETSTIQTTRPADKGSLGVNARLFDDFDAASAKVEGIDGKSLW